MNEKEVQELINKTIKKNNEIYENNISKLTKEIETLNEKNTLLDKKLSETSKEYDEFKTTQTEKYDKAINHILTEKVEKDEPNDKEPEYDPYTGKWSNEKGGE